MTDLSKKINELRDAGEKPATIAKILNCHLTTVYYHTSPKIRRRMINRLLALKKDNKTMALEYLGGQCIKCAYNSCRDAMVFHHRDPYKKDMRIGGTPHVWKTLQKELDKCVLLCCRCHTELHAGAWSQAEYARLGLAYIPNGVNTGRLILPLSKRQQR